MKRYLSKIEVITNGKYSVLSDEVLSISDMLVYYLGKTVITDGVTMLRLVFTDEAQEANSTLGITYIYTPILQWEKLSSSQDINTRRDILLIEIVTVIESLIAEGKWIDNGIKNIVQMIRKRDCVFFEVYKRKSCKIDSIYKCGIQFRYKSSDISTLILCIKCLFYIFASYLEIKQIRV